MGSAVHAARWSAASRLVIQLLSFVGSIVLARIVSPDDFGTAALVLVVSTFALILSDLGLGAALIHVETLTRRRIDTVFWLNALTGAGLTVLIWALSWPLAAVFHKPELVGLLWVSALTYTVALTVVPLALLERGLNLRPAALAELAATAGGLAVAVGLAVAGAGAYAVVANPLVTTALLSVGYWVATRYRPVGFVDRDELRSVWRYSRGLVGFNVVNYFTRNSDELLLGRFASSAALGYYSRAFLLMLVPVQQIQLIIGRVLFPSLSRLRHDRAAFVQAHRRALVLSSAICAPLALGAATCSRDFVLTCFGQRWAPMIPMLAILSTTGVQQVFQGTVGVLFQTIGRNDVMFRWNMLFSALTVGGFCIGIHWGALGICWAVAIRGWTLLPITLSVPLKLIGDRLSHVARALAPLVGCLALEAVAVLTVVVVTPTWLHSPAARLPLEVAAGALAYFVGLLLLDRRTLGDLRLILDSRRTSVSEPAEQPA